MALKLALLILVVVGVIFLPTTVFLAFGMMPTIAAFVTDRSVGRNKTICIGAMNFAGCFPFLLEFWTEFGQQTVENAFRMVSNVENILVIYMLAAGGYAIDKAVTGITSSLVIQRSEKRLKKIKIEQEKLVKRWGEKVTGQYRLDDYGFPIRPIPVKNNTVNDQPKTMQNKNRHDDDDDDDDSTQPSELSE